VKKSVFTQLDELADVNTVLASSSSAIPCSNFTESLRHRHRCIIVHPVCHLLSWVFKCIIVNVVYHLLYMNLLLIKKTGKITKNQ